MAQRTYSYKGWQLQQRAKGDWRLIRSADAYSTWHRSLNGGRAFIRLHGAAASPDLAYALATGAVLGDRLSLSLPLT